MITNLLMYSLFVLRESVLFRRFELAFITFEVTYFQVDSFDMLCQVLPG